MSVEIELVEFPKNLGIKEEYQTEYKLRALMINNKVKVFEELKEILKKDKNDYKKLIKNIKLQLQSKNILKNKRKIQVGKGKKQKNIIEIKATGGHSRLFGFIWNKEIIICTNTYWKTTSKKGRQDNAFNRAVEMRDLFIAYKEGE